MHDMLLLSAICSILCIYAVYDVVISDQASIPLTSICTVLAPQHSSSSLPLARSVSMYGVNLIY